MRTLSNWITRADKLSFHRPNELLPNIPKGIHDAAAHSAKRNMVSAVFENFEEGDPSEFDAAVITSDRLIERFHLPHLLQLAKIPRPLSIPGQRLVMDMLGRLALAIAVITAFTVVAKTSASGQTIVPMSPPSQSEFAPATKCGETEWRQVEFNPVTTSRAKSIQSEEATGSIQPPSRTPQKLIVNAADLKDVILQPPRGFAGAMDLRIELRLADDKLADRRSLRLEWSTAIPGTRSYARRHLDAKEIAALLKRGDELMASSDFAAARLVLLRAAEADDARAALTLAETYDPIVLEKLGVHGTRSRHREGARVVRESEAIRVGRCTAATQDAGEQAQLNYSMFRDRFKKEQAPHATPFRQGAIHVVSRGNRS